MRTGTGTGGVCLAKMGEVEVEVTVDEVGEGGDGQDADHKGV